MSNKSTPTPTPPAPDFDRIALTVAGWVPRWSTGDNKDDIGNCWRDPITGTMHTARDAMRRWQEREANTNG